MPSIEQKHARLGNRAITLGSILDADFAKMSDEDFTQVIAHAGTINRLLISPSRCNSPSHHEEVIAEAARLFRTTVTAKRVFGDASGRRTGKTIDLDAEFGKPLEADRAWRATQ